MKQLETLLNSLIQRGWEPWNRKADFCEYRFWKIRFIKESGEIVGIYTLRSLVSLESGLWQFVCERDLLKTIWKVRAKEPSMSALRLEFENLAFSFEPEYRLLESALIPEEELAKFLLDNIKI